MYLLGENARHVLTDVAASLERFDCPILAMRVRDIRDASQAPAPPAEPKGENSREVRNAFAYLRTIELACDARDDRQSVTYIGQIRELILQLGRAAQPPAEVAIHAPVEGSAKSSRDSGRESDSGCNAGSTPAGGSSPTTACLQGALEGILQLDIGRHSLTIAQDIARCALANYSVASKGAAQAAVTCESSDDGLHQCKECDQKWGAEVHAPNCAKWNYDGRVGAFLQPNVACTCSAQAAGDDAMLRKQLEFSEHQVAQFSATIAGFAEQHGQLLKLATELSEATADDPLAPSKRSPFEITADMIALLILPKVTAVANG